MSATLRYLVRDRDSNLRSLNLTVCTGEAVSGGLAQLRRETLRRILQEAYVQGAILSYRDLSIIMLSSRATLKRDIKKLKLDGVSLPLGLKAKDEEPHH